MGHGKSFSHVCTNFRFNEDWDVLLPESSLPLLRVGVLVVWFDPCSDNSAAFDDNNALKYITRAIRCGDRRFACQAFFDGITTWVYTMYMTWSMFPRSSKINMAANKHKLVYQIENYFPNLSSIYASFWNDKMVKIFEDLSYLQV